jgi:hypothetical protein
MHAVSLGLAGDVGLLEEHDAARSALSERGAGPPPPSTAAASLPVCGTCIYIVEYEGSVVSHGMRGQFSMVRGQKRVRYYRGRVVCGGKLFLPRLPCGDCGAGRVGKHSVQSFKARVIARLRTGSRWRRRGVSYARELSFLPASA